MKWFGTIVAAFIASASPMAGQENTSPAAAPVTADRAAAQLNHLEQAKRLLDEIDMKSMKAKDETLERLHSVQQKFDQLMAAYRAQGTGGADWRDNFSD